MNKRNRESTYSLEELQQLFELVSDVMKQGWTDSNRSLDMLYQDIAYRTPSFDWNNWNKGLQGLKNADFSVFSSDEVYDKQVTSNSFAEFNYEELGQLLLMIHRVSRFSDGYYEDSIENGVVLKMLDRLISLTKEDI